mmetsp:Transcript_9474/g.17181  ORF Transcript_9474/g.17181 Transcript_9474/m.17181 type:complete len:212 (+) Transcript_9474:160-795(+)
MGGLELGQKGSDGGHALAHVLVAHDQVNESVHHGGRLRVVCQGLVQGRFGRFPISRGHLCHGQTIQEHDTGSILFRHGRERMDGIGRCGSSRGRLDVNRAQLCQDRILIGLFQQTELFQCQIDPINFQINFQRQRNMLHGNAQMNQLQRLPHHSRHQKHMRRIQLKGRGRLRLIGIGLQGFQLLHHRLLGLLRRRQLILCRQSQHLNRRIT